jgi:ethanolamine ammonia-lyase small subunit
MEDSIRDIVEKVIVEMNKKQDTVVSNAQPVQIQVQPDVDAAALHDLSTVDLQRYLQVPNPVNRKHYEEMKLSTPARIGVWRCGTRPLTDTLLRLRADHAVAQDSVLGEVSQEFITRMNLIAVKTPCKDKDEYLTRPDLGRKLGGDALEQIRKACPQGAQVQIVVGDGLSSKAAEANVPDLLPAMVQGLNALGVKCGPVIFVKNARVAVMDAIGEELKPELIVFLIGERPGLGTAESLSAYIGYHPRAGMLESERTVVSNIHKGGIPATEAGAHLSTLIKKILDAKVSGVKLEA